MESPILNKSLLRRGVLSVSEHKNRDLREEYIRAMTNPQTERDWELVVWDSRSPYNRELMELISQDIAIADVINKMQVMQEVIMRAEGVAHDQYLKELSDAETAKQLVNGHNIHDLRPPIELVAAPKKKEYLVELKEQRHLLDGEIKQLRLQKDEYKQTISACRDKLDVIEESWTKRQTSQASDFASTINDNLAANDADFNLPMSPQLQKILEDAFKIAAPTKILKVNPELAKSPEVNADTMENVGNFVRRLKVLAEMNRAKQDPNNESAEEIFPKPSDLKKLDKQVSVPKLNADDKKEIVDAISAKKEWLVAEHGLEDVREVARKMKKERVHLEDRIRVLESTASTNRPPH
tara:strand:+ start:292 stop:1347 length:1056 start_codon:yes stop_codon:yes gene_type:complete